MNRSTRLIIIIGCIITFFVVPFVTWWVLSSRQQPKKSEGSSAAQQQNDTNLPTRSNSDLEGAIVAGRSQLVKDNQPTFVITATKKMKDGWYVVTIQLKDTPGDPAKVLLHDTSGGLSVILGPGTFFDPSVTDGLGIPSEVVQELNS